MQLPTALLALSLSLAATHASPVIEARGKPDHAAAILSDIATVSSDLTTLNNTLNTFQPDSILGIFTAETIMSETNALASQLNATVYSVRQSSDFSASESFDIANATVALIDPINSTIQNIVAHKPAFASVAIILDLSETVEKSLVEQKKLTKELGAALTARLAAPYNEFAPQVTAAILGIFNDAIAKYKSCSGILCLPPI